VPGEPSQTSPDGWINRVIDNRYRITEHIGRGGMGTVYKVVHTQIGKVAALKLLHGNLAGDKELIKRFHREAEAISKLNHPNIVQVFDFGRVDETVYLVMEYLKGDDLATILRRQGPLDLPRCASILIQICDALTEAHDLGIIHRDLKPENVRISRTRDGGDYIKVMDFGLAKMLMEDEQPDHRITAKGNLVGTPYYMAPELIRAQAIDHRADIYSLGAMAYRMLTGENAFIANTPVGVLTKHITDDLDPPSRRAPEQEIPPELDTVVLKAMAKDRGARYQSAGELKRDLLELLGQVPVGQAALSQPALRAPSSAVITPRRDAGLSVTERTVLEQLPTGPIEEVAELDSVLSKEDLGFERKLRRGRVLKPLILLPLLAAIGFGVYWFGLRERELYAPPMEFEPNNTPDKANPIAAAQPVKGYLGRRVSATESDRDWYSLQVEGSGPQTLQAKISRIPNMDITLELYDAAAGRITGADSAGTGGSEIITNWTVDPGRYYLLVREVWAVDVAPLENVTDAYNLVVRWQPHAPGWEMEPNDRPGQAMRLRAGETLRGHLGTVSDVDQVKVTSAAGRLSGTVSGINGVDLVVEVTPSKAAKAEVLDTNGRSQGERFENVVADGTQPVRIAIRRKNAKKTVVGNEAPGLDVPYTLKVWAAK